MRPVLNKDAKILLVGDFPYESDIRAGYPFAGHQGKELDAILADAGLSRSDISTTLVFLENPANNDINSWAVPRKGLARGQRLLACKKGVVDPARSGPALERLEADIQFANPNVILALGNTALAALCGVSGISKLRGALHFFQQRKVIPTYSPAALLKQYELRPIVVADFTKAKFESASPHATLRNRKIYIQPAIVDLYAWERRLAEASFLAFDIETKLKQITCIGFAPNELEAYVIPFWDEAGSYWNAADEACAYKVVRSICGNSAIKIAQNGLYDVSYLAKYKIPVRNFHHDTMLLHHSLYPAMPKALGFLGSIYTNERGWKAWRTRGDETAELKREE